MKTIVTRIDALAARCTYESSPSSHDRGWRVGMSPPVLKAMGRFNVGRVV